MLCPVLVAIHRKIRLNFPFCMASQQAPPSKLFRSTLCKKRIHYRLKPIRLLSYSNLRPNSTILDLSNSRVLVDGRGASVLSRVTVRASTSHLSEGWLTSLSSPLVGSSEVSSNDSEQEESGMGYGCVIGIDPDVSGAIAILRGEDSDASAEVFDTPSIQVSIGKKLRKRADARSMVQLLRSLGAPIGTKAYIEQSNPFPKDGRQGWWGGGFGYGLWIGVLVASGFSVVPVPSLLWKNRFNLSGSSITKDDSRTKASILFPSLISSLKRKKDHGRADALLIAAYGKGLRLNPEQCREENGSTLIKSMAAAAVSDAEDMGPLIPQAASPNQHEVVIPM